MLTQRGRACILLYRQSRRLAQRGSARLPCKPARGSQPTQLPDRPPMFFSRLVFNLTPAKAVGIRNSPLHRAFGDCFVAQCHHGQPYGGCASHPEAVPPLASCSGGYAACSDCDGGLWLLDGHRKSRLAHVFYGAGDCFSLPSQPGRLAAVLIEAQGSGIHVCVVSRGMETGDGCI